MAERSFGMVLNSHIITQDTEQIINPIQRPTVTHELSENVILTTVDDLYNWARLSSLWPLLFGTACCFIEFAALIGSRFDFDRFGLIPRCSPRQADLIITAGTITMKMAPQLVRLYEQMPEPKYVIAMGACTITGGMFSVDSPTAVRGVDKLIPVDVYLPGCPPRPAARLDARHRQPAWARPAPGLPIGRKTRRGCRVAAAPHCPPPSRPRSARGPRLH